MANFPTTESRQLLADLLASEDSAAADTLLVRLVESVIEPVATRLVRGRFRISVNQNNDSSLNQDALDIVSEVKVSMISVLRRMKDSEDTVPIDSLEGYTAIVTRNAYNEYLRKKYPSRFRLRNQIRYVVTNSEGLRISFEHGAVPMCGTDFAMVSNDLTDAASISLNGFAGELINSPGLLKKDINRIGLGELVGIVLRKVNKPVIFDDLVSVIAELRGLHEPTVVELTDEIHLSSMAIVPFAESERKTFLTTIWGEMSELPLRHRRAMLLHLTDDQNDNLLVMFVLDGIASIRSIAEMVEMPPEEFAGIWNRLPLPDNDIAELMGLERQQVINLRQSARRSLRSRLSNRGFYREGNFA